jgi:hypothetical protein
MKSFKVAGIVVVFALLLGTAPAYVAQGGQAEAGAVSQTPQSATAAETDQPTQNTQLKELTGTIEDTEAGIVMTSESGEYSVSGEDLSNMVGKTVKVTGAVEEAAGRYIIKVTSVSEVE